MRERLTTNKTKIFARESPTLMSITKAELRNLYNEVFDRLQEYEVAEEQGQIIVPPCKVGDTVYFVERNSGEPIGIVDEIEIVQIAKREEGFHAKGRFKGSLNEFEIRGFKIDNYSFYFTREEAEAALKGGAE